MIHLILLSGGSGTRLWPLSNDARSKQFLKVLRDKKNNHVSMVQRVFDQISKVPVKTDITIATCLSQKDSIERQVTGSYSLVLEPERRDTAPAIMLACAHILTEQDTSENDTVIVMPIDTYADQAYYDSIKQLDAAVQNCAIDLALLGVEPTYPSEKYGYIVPDRQGKSPWQVLKFKEKPDEVTAKELISHGALWNCGVFAFKLGYLANLVREKYDLACDFNYLHDNYQQLPKNSFDYEIVENANKIAVVPYAGEWKDLGTWNTLTEEMADATSGRTVGIETCRNTHVINELGFPLVTLGLENVVVVASSDGFLVANKDLASNIKPYVEKAAESRPMYEKRRWGEYRVLDAAKYHDGAKSLTKELTVEAGKQLSYQRHQRRAESWTVVSGQGEIVIDGQVQSIAAGSAITIAPGQLHSVRAREKLHIIEVQTGDILVEEDIERFGDFWK